MRIPFGILHARGTKRWRAQFARQIVASGSTMVWAHDQQQIALDEVNYSGELIGVRQTHAPRPPIRVQLYGLGEIASSSVGGSTSRLGADLSVPYTRTSSFVGTFHPDYSNVEIDQQSISPTEFPRMLQEVRPFFTQGAQYYNNFACGVGCPYQLPYTPIIPTFSTGYAVEGTEKFVTYGAFNALGMSRDDNAQSLTYVDSLRAFQASIQRVGVDFADFYDVARVGGVSYVNPHSHLALFANSGADSGTNVTNPSQARYEDGGVGIGNSTSSIDFDVRHLGSQFVPADGYVTQPDIAGWSTDASKQITFSPTSQLLDASISLIADRYKDHAGNVAQV